MLVTLCRQNFYPSLRHGYYIQKSMGLVACFRPKIKNLQKVNYRQYHQNNINEFCPEQLGCSTWTVNIKR